MRVKLSTNSWHFKCKPASTFQILLLFPLDWIAGGAATANNVNYKSKTKAVDQRLLFFPSIFVLFCEFCWIWSADRQPRYPFRTAFSSFFISYLCFFSGQQQSCHSAVNKCLPTAATSTVNILQLFYLSAQWQCHKSAAQVQDKHFRLSFFCILLISWPSLWLCWFVSMHQYIWACVWVCAQWLFVTSRIRTVAF